MTTMEKIGLGIGILIALVRLPAIIWPAGYVRTLRGMVLDRPLVVRVLGALLLVVAVTLVTLVAQTLTLFQTVMLVIAVFFVAGGMGMLAFTDAYRAVADRMVGASPEIVVRLGGVVGVALGVWIVVLSLSVR